MRGGDPAIAGEATHPHERQEEKRRRKLRLPQPGRHPQQRRLAEPIDRAAALPQPLHDRRRRQLADRLVVSRRRTRLDHPDVPCQSRHRLMLEHRPGVSKSPARRARLTSWIDTMLSPPSSKKLSSMPTRSTPRTSANSPHSFSSAACAAPVPTRRASSPAPATPAVELAVRRQRQRFKHHKRRRHHVVRQPLASARHATPDVKRAPRRRNHIRHQPLSPGNLRARPPPPSPPPHAAPAQPRSRQARCGSRAASPARPRAPGTPACRPYASAPGPRSDTSGCRARQRVRNEPLRRQPRPAQIAPRQPSPAM